MTGTNDTPTETDNSIPGVDGEAVEDLPYTAVEVHTHVHFGMTGSFPLRLAELFFADDGLYIVEYGYITPLFGLGARKHHREAEAMASVFDHHGLDEVLVQGDSVTWLNYATVSQVVLYDGGRLGRPKIAVQPNYGSSYAYRLHDDTIFEDLALDIEDVGERYEITVDRRTGVGFSPGESLRRFFDRG
jgi:hypothetical protein